MTHNIGTKLMMMEKRFLVRIGPCYEAGKSYVGERGVKKAMVGKVVVLKTNNHYSKDSNFFFIHKKKEK